MSCRHERTEQVGREHGFRGSVAATAEDENRAAHGCITYTVECLECGSRRSVNRNQWHYEFGLWGPTRAQRRDEADRAAALAGRLRAGYPERPSPVTVEGSVVVECEADGMLLLRGLDGFEVRGHEREIASSLPVEWLESARAVRSHHQRVLHAETTTADLRAAI